MIFEEFFNAKEKPRRGNPSFKPKRVYYKDELFNSVYALRKKYKLPSKYYRQCVSKGIIREID